MQQQREVQQVRLLEFLQQFGVALVPFGLRLPQRMQIIDGHERMLVYREAVRIIAHHQRIDSGKFREEQCEQAQRVHRA